MADVSTRDDQLKATFASALTQRPSQPHSAPAAVGMQQGRKVDRSLFLLAIDRIRPDDDQVRRMNKSESDAEMIELADSIRQFGVMEPLNVRYLPDADIYELIAGERRFTAAKMTGLLEVPVKLVDADDQQAKLRQLHENIHRANLHPLDLATALHGLLDEGASVEDLTKLLNKSTSYVQKALSVSKELSPEAKAAVQAAPEQHKSLENLYEVSRLPADAQPAMIERIASENLTREQLREVTAEAKAEHKEERGQKRGRPTTSKSYSKSFSSKNGAKVVVTFKKSKATTQDLITALSEILATLQS